MIVAKRVELRLFNGACSLVHRGERHLAFQGLPGSSFAVEGARLADHSALVSAGGEPHITRTLSLLSKFDAEFADRSSAVLRFWLVTAAKP